jgi:hypothetical protein
MEDKPNWMWCKYKDHHININIKCYSNKRKKGDNLCPYKECWKHKEDKK